MRRDEHGPRRGLRLRFGAIDPMLREAIMNYAKWLRLHFDFPIRVPVYISVRRRVIAMDGEEATATFFAPFDQNVEPYIRLPTGDFDDLVAEGGEFATIATILCSLTHEVIHYQQWCATGKTHERGVRVRAENTVQRYIDETTCW